MSDRSYLSIGEVLSLLTAEFPDVTISKIRFLESQGLIDPERTPSGYRKFYETDVERLKWILRQQRENFLPLKVIRGRLGDEPEAAAETAPETESMQAHPTSAGASSQRRGCSAGRTRGAARAGRRRCTRSTTSRRRSPRCAASPVSASPAAEAAEPPCRGEVSPHPYGRRTRRPATDPRSR